MGQSELPFKAFIRFLADALRDAEEETDEAKRSGKTEKIIDNLQKTLEDRIKTEKEKSHMKKTGRILALAIALCMVLCLGALASDETVMSMNASAETGAVSIAVDENGMTFTDTGTGIALGDIDETGVYDAFVELGEFTNSFIKVTGGEYAISNSVIVKNVTAPVDANAAGGAIASVSNGTLYIVNSLLVNNGKGGRNGNYTVDCESTGTMVVIDSNIYQLGAIGDIRGYTDDIADPPSNLGLLISGYARSNMSVGRSQTYYYGSYVVTEGWAAMSTDSAQSGFAFYSYDSIGEALYGGYGTYADTSCVDWFYASQLRSAEVGAIISNNGEIHMRNGADADEAVLAYLPEDYEVTANYGDGRSLVIAGRNDFQLHSPDMGGGGANGDFTAVLDLSDTDIITSADYDANATLIDWSVDYGPAVGEYVDYIKGANILVKSTCADIDLDNVYAESTSGVLLLTALNSDSMSRYAKATDDMTDHYVELTISNSDIAGDVVHADYQRNTSVVLDNATWSGAYVTVGMDEWNAIWSDAAKADDYCYWILDTEKYHDDAGTVSEMYVGADSVWNVTGDSNIDMLAVAEGGVVNGVVTVDGVAVDVNAGGIWEGDIVVTPGEAAPAASGEASAEAGSVEDAYKEYLHEWLIAEDEVNDTMTEEIRENEFMPLIWAGDYETFPAEMLWSGMLENGSPMTFEEFAAQY